MNVLLVDDHVLIRDAVRAVVLEVTPGARIEEAMSAGGVLDRFKTSPEIHLLVLDINVPDRSGLAVLRHVRSVSAATAVVVLSGHHERELERRARSVNREIPFSREQ